MSFGSNMTFLPTPAQMAFRGTDEVLFQREMRIRELPGYKHFQNELPGYSIRQLSDLLSEL